MSQLGPSNSSMQFIYMKIILIQPAIWKSLLLLLQENNLCTTIFNEFTSTYYDNKNDGFEMLFRYYTANYVNIIGQPALIQ